MRRGVKPDLLRFDDEEDVSPGFEAEVQHGRRGDIGGQPEASVGQIGAPDTDGVAPQDHIGDRGGNDVARASCTAQAGWSTL